VFKTQVRLQVIEDAIFNSKQKILARLSYRNAIDSTESESEKELQISRLECYRPRSRIDRKLWEGISKPDKSASKRTEERAAPIPARVKTKSPKRRLRP
jgi:hypothetical protein